MKLEGKRPLVCPVCGGLDAFLSSYGQSGVGVWIMWESVEHVRLVCSPKCARQVLDRMEVLGPTVNPWSRRTMPTKQQPQKPTRSSDDA